MAAFLIFFVLMVYLSTTGLRQERLGTFREDAKAQIDALREVCSTSHRGPLANAVSSRGAASTGGSAASCSKPRQVGLVLLPSRRSSRNRVGLPPVLPLE